MNKKELKKMPHISMEHCIRHYLKINNNHVLKQLKELSHQELKQVYEEIYGVKLKCLPFEVVTLDDLMRGEVLLVDDKKNHFAPYINPIQIHFKDIMETERKRDLENQNKFQSYEEYTDNIDNIALDQNTSSSHIKVLSHKKYEK